MTSLPPSTRIYYKVGASAPGFQYSAEFSFLTAPESGAPGATVSIIAAADMGHYVPDKALEWNPQVRAQSSLLLMLLGLDSTGQSQACAISLPCMLIFTGQHCHHWKVWIQYRTWITSLLRHRKCRNVYGAEWAAGLTGVRLLRGLPAARAVLSSCSTACPHAHNRPATRSARRWLTLPALLAVHYKCTRCRSS